MMNLFYNPFLRVNEHSLTQLVEAAKPYLVIQRFEWPGVEKGSLVSGYKNQQEARLHANELAVKKGKYLNLLVEADREKVLELVKTESGYNVFFNGTIDRKNEKRLQDAYRKSVSYYIRSIRMKKMEDEVTASGSTSNTGG